MSESSAARRPSDTGPCLCGREDRRHVCGWETFGADAIFALLLGALGVVGLMLLGVAAWSLWS